MTTPESRLRTGLPSVCVLTYKLHYLRASKESLFAVSMIAESRNDACSQTSALVGPRPILALYRPTWDRSVPTLPGE